jgi:hypothetical protein
MMNDENSARNHLEASNADGEFSKASVKGFEKLIQEREHWRTEALRFTEEVTRLQYQVSSMKEEKDAKDLLIESMKRDEQVFNNRISAMTTEHRELKNHWLAEKSDLQSRLFQVQALNTQIHGTLKKKEKDYEKLQSQLSKLVKDSGRGAPKAAITVSVPLKKAFSQESSGERTASAASLLRDAELIALRNTLSALNKDNTALKTSIEELQDELVRLRVIDVPVTVPTEAVSIITEKIVSASPAKSTSEFSSSSVSTPSANEPTTTTSIAAEPTTPGVRSVRWLIDQTHTAVKQLRDRAVLVASNQLSESTDRPASTQNNSLEATQAVVGLKARLTEALRVIEEQDRLIHEALLGKLPGQLQPDAPPAEVVWEDTMNSEFALLADQDEYDLYEKQGPEARRLSASAKKLRRRSLRNSYLSAQTTASNVTAALDTKMGKNTSKNSSRRESFSLEDFEADLFPPASPDTLQLLEKSGWQLPKGSFMLPSNSLGPKDRTSLGGNAAAPLVRPEVLEF